MLAIYIKKLRKHYRLSQRELAQKSHMTDGHVSRVEKSKSAISPLYASSLLSALNIHPHHHESFLKGIVHPDFSILLDGSIRERSGRIKTANGFYILNASFAYRLTGEYYGFNLILCPKDDSSLLFNSAMTSCGYFNELKNSEADNMIELHGDRCIPITDGSIVNVYGDVNADSRQKIIDEKRRNILKAWDDLERNRDAESVKSILLLMIKALS